MKEGFTCEKLLTRLFCVEKSDTEGITLSDSASKWTHFNFLQASFLSDFFLERACDHETFF